MREIRSIELTVLKKSRLYLEGWKFTFVPIRLYHWPTSHKVLWSRNFKKVDISHFFNDSFKKNIDQKVIKYVSNIFLHEKMYKDSTDFEAWKLKKLWVIKSKIWNNPGQKSLKKCRRLKWMVPRSIALCIPKSNIF